MRRRQVKGSRRSISWAQGGAEAGGAAGIRAGSVPPGAGQR